MYVSGRVVMLYRPLPSVSRQMRPVVNAVSTHTSAFATGSPLGVRSTPFSCGPLVSATSMDLSRVRSTAVEPTPVSAPAYHCGTARTFAGGTVHT